MRNHLIQMEKCEVTWLGNCYCHFISPKLFIHVMCISFERDFHSSNMNFSIFNKLAMRLICTAHPVNPFVVSLSCTKQPMFYYDYYMMMLVKVFSFLLLLLTTCLLERCQKEILTSRFPREMCWIDFTSLHNTRHVHSSTTQWITSI
jgi:hypothetical protein